MREYHENTKELLRAICNCCGRELKVRNGILMEGICSVDTDWGYFSTKDLEHHSFDLCEACYQRITEKFVIPPEVAENTEV